MTTLKHAPGSVPNPHCSQEDWNEVSDNPPLTDEELARMRPGTEGMPPDVAAAFESRAARRRESRSSDGSTVD